MTLEEQAEKVFNWYLSHKRELDSTHSGSGLNHALRLLYDMYFSASDVENASKLREAICELISTYDTVDLLMDELHSAYEENAESERLHYNNMKGLHDIR